MAETGDVLSSQVIRAVPPLPPLPPPLPPPPLLEAAAKVTSSIQYVWAPRLATSTSGEIAMIVYDFDGLTPLRSQLSVCHVLAAETFGVAVTSTDEPSVASTL